MKAICFYFQIHQPFRLKRYRFFDIGNDHYYYDDFANDDIITRIAHRSYIPAAESLLRMIEASKGKFKCAISVTGTALEQFEQYVPEFIDLLKKLAETGCVEFLAETYAHSLSSLADPDEFINQVKVHDEKNQRTLRTDSQSPPKHRAHLQRRTRTAHPEHGLQRRNHRRSQTHPRMEIA